MSSRNSKTPHCTQKQNWFSTLVSFTRSTTIRVFTLCVVIALSASILYSVRRGFAAAVPKAELSVTPLTASQLQLSWRLTDTGSVGSVLIYRALSANGEYSLIRTAAANIASYTDIGLNSNTVYYYQVKIRAPLGNITASSNIASAVTLAGVSSPTPTPTPAATPTPTPVASPTPTPEPAPSPGRLPGIYAAPNGSPNNNGSLERPIDLATALSTRSPARPGATIWLRGGTYRGAFTSFLAGTSSAPITVRQYPGERATIDGATSSNPALTVNGQWTNYWGFEVTNSNPDRTLERPSGLMIYGPYTKFINLVVHDTGVGMGFWTPALNAEIYGCIVYRNGWQGPAPDRGHGHGIYSQNAEGTKRIVDNIIFNQFGYGIHNYTQAGDLKGFYIEGNIVFRNGSMATPNDVDDPNILVGGTKPAERVTLKNNYTYHPLSMVATNVGLNYNAKNNRDLVVEGNYIAGGSPLSATEWYQLSGSNNTLIGARDILGFVLPAGLPTSDYLWDRNTYISTHPSAGASPMTLYSTARTGAFTFAEWPSVTGFDRNSTFLRVSRPTGIKAFVRANQYEAGRANIVIYNWDLNPTVDLNLGGLLANGARYEIRNVHDFYGSPVVSGIYDGRPVRLPMNGSPTGPEFNAFVLITLSGVSTSINPTPTPSATPAPTPAPTPTPTPAPTPTPPSLPSDFNPDITLDEEETLLLDLINQYRLQNGRNPLGASISLCNASEWLSRDMLTFNHTNKIDSLGRSPARRARDFGFPGNSAPIEEDALLAAGDLDAQRVFDLWRGSAPSSQMLLAPNWKAAGLARSLNPLTQRWYWNVATGAYWDKTILLAGEDEEGKIDRNELIRTRPLDSSLQEEHRFSGYGDDGSTYTPIHCDLTLNSQFCWHDPPPQTNRKLLEPSLPANLAGAWQVAYTISSLGIVHANYDQWDRTNFSMEFQINPGGTWTMRGYRSSQYPVPSESGTWQSTRDVDRNEETVTFIRQNALPRATIRIHATRDQLTFFAIDGGAFMKNFLRGLLPDDMPKDDPQIVFVPKR